MRRLADCLMKADYDLLERLLSHSGAKRNCYSKFFERFAGSHFLTFNYDSLPELFLLHQNQWNPQDGYGVTVACEIYPHRKSHENRPSTSLVLHLHGSFCLYTSGYTLEEVPGENVALLRQREQLQFRFDPDKIGTLFFPFKRVPPDHAWDLPESRVIAPVPDKTEGIKKEFVSEVYRRADELLRSATLPVVAIGYSFASVLLISPDAVRMGEMLSLEFPRVNFESLEHTFKSWVEAGFPGVQ
jgi:hypothetical protein